MKRKRNVLFLCTGNCCRSQMAEAILAHRGGSRFAAHSAGSDPAGYVHALVPAALEHLGIPLPPTAHSKSWDVFADTPMDLIVTVCDAAAGVCPAWTRRGRLAHWPMPDPSFLPGSHEERVAAAVRVAERLQLKIDHLTAIDFDTSSETDIRQRLAEIADL
jgi:arsenate reductase